MDDFYEVKPHCSTSTFTAGVPWCKDCAVSGTIIHDQSCKNKMLNTSFTLPERYLLNVIHTVSSINSFHLPRRLIMKKRLLILSIALVVIGLLPIFSMFAQTAVAVYYPLNSDANKTAVQAIGTTLTGVTEVLGSNTAQPTSSLYQTFTSGTVFQRLTYSATFTGTVNVFDTTMYSQFRFNPTSGNYFMSDSITVDMIGAGTGGVYAAIAYSTDSTAPAANWTSISTLYRNYSTTPTTNVATTTKALGSVTAYFANLTNSSSDTKALEHFSTATSAANPSVTVKGGKAIFVRVYFYHASGKAIGIANVKMWGKTNTASAPTVSATTSASSITATTAVSGGSISADGNSIVTTRGVCWNTTTAPTISGGGNYLGSTSNGTGTGSFSSTLIPLSTLTTYYARAYATNDVGTSYGPEISFTTLAPALATVTTGTVSSITKTSASVSGIVVTDGGASVTAYGVCWNTTGSPTIADSYTTDGAGVSSFTSTLSSLTQGTTYYVSAYATNSVGTAYGTVDTFRTCITYYNVASSDVSVLTNWGTSTDGSGTNPTDFSGANSTYLMSNSGATLSANWTVSGTNAVVQLGDGATPNTFTIPSSYSLAGKVNVAAASTLTVQNTTILVLGTLDTSSTVAFDGTSALTIPAARYGNLSSTNDAGGTRTLTTSDTIGIAGTFTPGSATYTVTSSSVLFNGASAQSIPPFTFYNLVTKSAAVVNASDIVKIASGGKIIVAAGSLTVNGTLDNNSSSSPTLTGTMTLKSGGTYIIEVGASSFPLATYESGSNVIVNGTATPVLLSTLNTNLTWNSTGAVGLAASSKVINGNFIMNAGTLNIGSGGVVLTFQVNGNMTVNGGTFTGGNGTVTTTQNIVVTGNLTVTGGALYPSDCSAFGALGNLYVAGNIVHTGGNIGNGNTAGSNHTTKIYLNGTSGTQSIQTIGFTNAPVLVINNTGSGVVLASALSIVDSLRLVRGVVWLGSNNLIFGATAAVAGSPSSGAMLYANSTGEVRKLFSAASSFTFPIGDTISGTGEYAPVSVSVSALDYSSGTAYVTVNTTRSKHPSNTSATDFLNRYWTMNASGFTDASYTGTFTYPVVDVAGSESLIFGAEYASSTWTNVGAVSTSSHSFSTPTLASLGDFTCADGTVVPTVPILTSSVAGLSFGRVNRTTTSVEKTYVLTGYYLLPAADSITVVAPANYQVSLTSGSGFADSVKIPYTGNSLSATAVYVHFIAPSVTSATTYSGSIINKGGGVTTQYILLTGKSIVSNTDLGVDMVIAADGSGDYTTTTAGFAAIPPIHTSSPYKVFIRSGTYFEKVTLPSTVRDIQLIGEDRDSTILNYNLYSVSGSYNASTTINSNNVTAINLTFKNSAGDSAQALALMTAGDSIIFKNCKLLAKQDTYLGNGGRVYFKNCFVEGTVDFIYGPSVMVFDSCTIHVIRTGGYITAASTDAASKFGINFLDCTITNDLLDYRGTAFDSTANYYYLGRPWHYGPRVVYIRCYEPAAVAPAGWTTMSGTTPTLYGEYKCSGPGYRPSSRTTIWGTAVRTLSDSEAQAYTISNIFAAATYSGFTSDWMPAGAVDVALPVELTSFTATTSGLIANLVWKTVAEKNNYGFDVERRTVGASAWTKLGFVTGNGTSNIAHSYSYTDVSIAAGTYVYRLKQIDNGGNFVYSNETQVAIGVAAKILTLANYPNPFNPTTTIQFSVPVDGKAVVKIFNVLGQEIVTAFNGEVKAGQYNQATFDGAKFSSGVYFYTIENNGQRMVKKMMMLK
jgi:pectin methylesterase-like acyl-CoA thioesterase